MRWTAIDRLWIFWTACLLCGVSLVIVLTLATAVASKFFSGTTYENKLFGVLLSCHDLGKTIYLEEPWLLKPLASYETPTLINQPKTITAELGGQSIARNLRVSNNSIDESAFLRLVWQNEASIPHLDFTRLYPLSAEIGDNLSVQDLGGINAYQCPESAESEEVTESFQIDIRTPFKWDPLGQALGLPSNKSNEIPAVTAEAMREATCFYGTSKWSFRIADYEWCSDLAMVPGEGREVPYMEPTDKLFSIKVNVTGTRKWTQPPALKDCNKKPPALNGRTSYYDSESVYRDFSMSSLEIDTDGSSSVLGIITGRGSTGNSYTPPDLGIGLLYVCYTNTGEPVISGNTMILDALTRKPVQVQGGARFIKTWKQVDPRDSSVHNFVAFIALCGKSTNSLVIGELLNGPVQEFGICESNNYPRRSFYFYKISEIPLTTECIDPLHTFHCQIQCQRIYDFSIRTSRIKGDDEKWLPKDGTFFVMSMVLCDTALRFDRFHLPFTDLLNLKTTEAYKVETKYLAVSALDSTTRMQFDNFQSEGEEDVRVDGIWHSQYVAVPLTVDTSIERPFLEYCGYADRNVLWELRLDELFSQRACLRKWLNALHRIPYEIFQTRNHSVAFPVRNYGVLMTNVSCAYCSQDAFPIMKIPREEKLLLSIEDGVAGVASVTNFSPTRILVDPIDPKLHYYWDAGNSVLRWTSIQGSSDQDWELIRSMSPLFVPQSRLPVAPYYLQWAFDDEGKRKVLSSHFSQTGVSLVTKNDAFCSLEFEPISQSLSPVGAIYASNTDNVFVWTEPMTESTFLTQREAFLNGQAEDMTRRLDSVNGKVFVSIGYSARKQQIFLSSPEEGSIYSVGLNSDIYSIVFRASDRTQAGNILKALRPAKIFVEQSSDAIYFNVLPAVNISGLYDPTWVNASYYDELFYQKGTYGWKRLDLSQFPHVSPGPLNLANSIWVLRPDFTAKSLMAEPVPYYTNPDAHVIGIWGHSDALIAIERKLSNDQMILFRVIKIPVLHFSPDIFETIHPLGPSQAQVLLDWGPENPNFVMAPTGEAGFFSDVGEFDGQLSRKVFGWIAFAVLMVHVCVAAGYNFKM